MHNLTLHSSYPGHICVLEPHGAPSKTGRNPSSHGWKGTGMKEASLFPSRTKQEGDLLLPVIRTRKDGAHLPPPLPARYKDEQGLAAHFPKVYRKRSSSRQFLPFTAMYHSNGIVPGKLARLETGAVGPDKQ